jgi:hypothetical protein
MKVNCLVIHHSASSPDTTVGDIERWHKARGFKFTKPKLDYPYSHIGYHKIILKVGTIINGRPEDKIGAHCKGNNRNTLGICCIGDFTLYSPHPLQLNGLTHCCAVLCKRYNLDPEKAITLHKDWMATACPGEYLEKHKSEIIKRIKGKLEND